MSLLASNFDIVSVDNPVALAALAIVLPVDSTLQPSPAFTANGTPAQIGAGIPPGTIVTYNTSGNAVLATSGAILEATYTGVNLLANFKPMFVVIDGNTDYSGAFTQKVTCLQGGFTMVTDQWSSATPATDFPVGKLVCVTSGKITIGVAANQKFGFIGPAGYDSVAGTIQVIVPQGGIG